MKNPVVASLFVVGAIVLLFVANVIWSWFIWPRISDPILMWQVENSPDRIVGTYACDSSEYAWQTVKRDYVLPGSYAQGDDYTGGSPFGTGASGVDVVVLVKLVHNGQTITESYVPDFSDALSLKLNYRGAEGISSPEDYRRLADFDLNRNGTRKTHVLGAEVMAYQEERSQNRFSYRGVVIPESRISITDFDLVSRCLNDNLSMINEQIDTSATPDHIGHFNQLGWISYQYDSAKPQEAKIDVLD